MNEKTEKEKNLKELFEFGIIKIDKPAKKTSFDVSDFVRKKLKPFGARKTSHFGTLDPMVTGVLPIALNRACKLTGYFLGEDKEYIGIMRIHEEIDIEKIKEKIKENFVGKIIQMPPVKSRVKRQKREREIKRFDILEKDGKDILFHVECQGGTYIRKLIHDLGESLEVGMHMLELRRTRAGIFKEKGDYPLVKIHELEKAIDECKKGNKEPLKKLIIPAEIVSEVYSPIEIKEDNLKTILTGKPIYKSDVEKDTGVKKDSIISVFCKGKFIGMYDVLRGKEIFAKPRFVMQPLRE